MCISIFKKSFFLAFLLNCFVIPLFCQQYSYTGYDVKDGLAGATVYTIAQDKEGFIWFGTETGLSRYDGTHFKNFYTSDGLSDNEILKLFVDSKNRIWVIPFKKSVCYYWKGEIHNSKNDTLLKRLKISSELVSISEDRDKNLFIAEKRQIHIISPNGKITHINLYEGAPVFIFSAAINKDGFFHAFINYQNENFFAVVDIDKGKMIKDSVRLSEKKLVTNYMSPEVDVAHGWDSLHFFFNKDHSESTLHFPNGFINVSKLNDSLITLNSLNGADVYSVKAKKIIDTLLKSQTIYDVTKDEENNIWLAAAGKGVYRLAPNGFSNYSSGLPNKSVYSIQKFNSLVFAGTSDFSIMKVDPNSKTMKVLKFWKGPTQGRVNSIAKDKKNYLFVGTDAGLFRLKDSKIMESLKYASVKSIFLEPDNKLLLGLNTGILELETESFKNNRYLLSERTTCIYKCRDLLYFGTLDGLYSMNSKNEISFLGEKNEVLQNRINAISESDDSTLWIATNGGGIVGLRQNKIATIINQANGLSSNICRSIFISPNSIWAGTDKGLNKISLNAAGNKIITYSIADGLSSDIINAVYVDGNDIYVGTPEGLTFFNESAVSQTSICKLQFLSIHAGEILLPSDSSNFILTHSENHLSFEYVGISLKSSGKISYQYRLLGLDTIWRTTTETHLNYQSLPSGQYTFQLKATNKFGVQSDVKELRFSISKTIWEEPWFKLLLIGLVAFGIWGIMNYRIGIIKKKDNERLATVQKISALEQMALRSQMNPHFIFNCLNSIQDFVIDKNIHGANEFIARFSKLIRLTLDNSSHQSISLADELVYIKNYLEIEQIRFEHKFSFSINSDGIEKDIYSIPPMILQPYIENAIRHGVRNRDDDNGKISIDIEKNKDYLICKISDNGIGRKLAQEFKSKNQIVYQSKGMELTSKRIDVFNTVHTANIKVEVNNLEDSNKAMPGTVVKIYFPLKEIQTKQEQT